MGAEVDDPFLDHFLPDVVGELVSALPVLDEIGAVAMGAEVDPFLDDFLLPPLLDAVGELVSAVPVLPRLELGAVVASRNRGESVLMSPLLPPLDLLALVEGPDPVLLDVGARDPNLFSSPLLAWSPWLVPFEPPLEALLPLLDPPLEPPLLPSFEPPLLPSLLPLLDLVPLLKPLLPVGVFLLSCGARVEPLLLETDGARVVRE